MELTSYGHVIITVVMATHSNHSAQQWIPFSKALLCVKKCVHFHRLAQYWYNTEAMSKYIEKHIY
jgi:hypothetical protein